MSLAAALLAACGGEATEPAAPAVVTVVDPSVLTGAWTNEAAVSVGADAQAIGLESGRHVVVVADGRVDVVVRDGLEARPLFSEAGEPDSMGVARVVRSRPGGGAWIAGTGGLYALDRHFVVRSPLSEAAADVFDVAEATSGPLAGVWVLAADGLLWRTDAGVQRVTLDLEAPRWLALDPAGAQLLVASETKVVRIFEDGGLVTLDPALDTGAIHGLAADTRGLWVGAARGLFLTTDGVAWTRYPLGGAEVLEVTSDPATGAAWARTTNQLFHVLGQAVTAYPGRSSERGLAVDQLGDVYGLDSGALFSRGTGLTGGDAVTFAEVRPWLETHCSQCHKNQTADFEVYQVFVEFAEDALTRVRAGDMPRCAGSARCAEEDALSPSDYAVLEQWLRDGMPE